LFNKCKEFSVNRQKNKEQVGDGIAHPGTSLWTVAATHRVVIEIALPNTKPFWQHKFQMDYQKTKITFEYYL